MKEFGTIQTTIRTVLLQDYITKRTDRKGELQKIIKGTETIVRSRRIRTTDRKGELTNYVIVNKISGLHYQNLRSIRDSDQDKYIKYRESISKKKEDKT